MELTALLIGSAGLGIFISNDIIKTKIKDIINNIKYVQNNFQIFFWNKGIRSVKTKKI